MPATVVDEAVLAARVPSGVPGLDALVGGGFPFHRTVLVCGDIGTGKTTFGLQFLMEGATRGEAGVLVSVDEKPQHLVADARQFGWDLDGVIDRQLITVLDASPCFTALRGRNGLDARHIASDLTQQIRRVKASRLVIDGATSLVPDGAPVAAVADFLRSLIISLEDNLGCTTVLITRTSAGTHTSSVGPTAERLASGVIELTLGPVGRRGSRGLLVRKMRGAPTALGERPFDIVDGRGLVLREPDDGDTRDGSHRAQERLRVDLTAAAELCTDLSRVTSMEALRDPLGRAAAILNASGVAVWMGAGEQLCAVIGHGYSAHTLARLGPIAREADNAAAEAWRSGQMTIVRADGTANGAVVAPMLASDACIGVLAIEVRHGGELDPATQAVAAMVAAQLAIVVPAWSTGTLESAPSATPDTASDAVRSC